MSYLGISAEDFNPQILYIFKASNKNGYTGKYHCHDFIELSYMVSGTASYTLENGGCEVKDGDLMVFNPGVHHQEVIPSGTPSLELHIGINKLALKGLCPNSMLPCDTSPLVAIVKYAGEFNSCINQIIMEQERKQPGHELIVKTLVMRLIVILLRELYALEEGSDNYNLSFESSEKSNIVNTVLNYIKENYDKEISLDKLSKNTYLSPVYLSRIFKEETGDSPINYLINTRLDKARELLETENVTIKSAAKSVGYNDAYYFSKLFKKHYGISPSSIKKRV